MSVQQSALDVQAWTLEALTFLQKYQFLLQYAPTPTATATAPVTTTSDAFSSDVAPVVGDTSADNDVLGDSNSRNDTLASSPLGKATTLSGISPKDAVVVSNTAVKMT
jgi:hypothetical protein